MSLQSKTNLEPSKKDTPQITDIPVVVASESADDFINDYTRTRVSNLKENSDKLPPADQDVDFVPHADDEPSIEDALELKILSSSPLEPARQQLFPLPQTPLGVYMPPPLQPTVIRRKRRNRTIDWKCPPPTPSRKSARISIRRNTVDIRLSPPLPTTIKKKPLKPVKANRTKVDGEYNYI